jgi:hypothetical protein
MTVSPDEITVYEDHRNEGEWRVEYFDADGDCYATIFIGPEAQSRAQDYADALKAGRLKPVHIN